MEEEKKVDKKKKRFAARLKSSKGIICTEKPSRNIVICNVGQATGLTKDDVHDLIRKNLANLALPKLIAEKGETHSFLVFASEEEAALFYNECNGKCKLCGTIIYMNFVESVPNLKVICKDDPPEGLLILEDFLTPAEEELFLKLFDFEESGSLKNRQVKHYGYEFRYGSNDVDLSSPLEQGIPKECDVFWQRLKEQGIDIEEPDQLTVNKYKPGQGIPSHVDKHSPFGDTILSVSLGSSIVMDWRHHSGKFVPIVVPARSILIMQGEARYDWRHGIQPRSWDPVIRSLAAGRVVTSDTAARGPRVSLTFRHTRAGACCCPHRTLCDAGGEGEVGDEEAERLEELHVHQVYEQIAGHFSNTRHTPWPGVVQFLRTVPPGSIVLDLGAGNGKNILPRDDIIQIAGERSSGLLLECHRRIQTAGRAADCARLDLCAVPFRDACADCVICIAVVHHFSSKSRRIAALSSISRVLRPGGTALITVWARDQTRSNYLSQSKQSSEELRVTVGGVTLPVHENRTQFRHQDLLVPWKLRSVKGRLSNDGTSTNDGKSTNASKLSNSLSNANELSKDSLSNASKLSKDSLSNASELSKDSLSNASKLSKDSLSNASELSNDSLPDDGKLSYDSKSSNISKVSNDDELNNSQLLNASKMSNDSKMSKDGETTLLRYYHVFEEGELDALCNETGGLLVEESYYDEGNWCVICRKIKD